MLLFTDKNGVDQGPIYD